VSNHSRAFPLISRRESPFRRFSTQLYIKNKLLFPLIENPVGGARQAGIGRAKVRKAKMDFNGASRARDTHSSPKSYN